MLQNSFSRVSSSFGRTVSRTMAGAVKSSLFDAKDAASDTVDVGTSFKPTSVLSSTDNVHSFNKPSFSVDGGAVKLDSPTLFDMSEGSIDFETKMSVFRVGGFDFGSFVSAYFAHREKMGSTREVLRRMNIKGEEVTLEVVRPEQAQECVDFQNSLPEKDKRTVELRSLETWRKSADGENFLFCVRNSEGKIVATSGTILAKAVDATHVKIDENSKFYRFKDCDFYELSISIVDPKYRGNQLQKVIYKELCERIKKLKKDQNRLFVAACVLGNFPSALNIIDSGLEVCGLHELVVNGNQKDVVVFAKYPNENNKGKEEEIKEGKTVLEDKNCLRKILDQGKSVTSRVDPVSGTRKYYAVTR